jgi:hypothetical protein
MQRTEAFEPEQQMAEFVLPAKHTLNGVEQLLEDRRVRATVQPFLDVRTAVLNDTLEDAFRRRYPGCRPANDDEAVALAA